MQIKMYATRTCPFCVMARRLLESKGVEFEEIAADRGSAGREEMERLSGQRTVPQIFIGDHHVGGCDELHALDSDGSLDRLVEQAAG